jgi:hypothetical protein
VGGSGSGTTATHLYASFLPTQEDGTDTEFRNVGLQNSDAGEITRRLYSTFTTRRKSKSYIKFFVLGFLVTAVLLSVMPVNA